jgi:hypothetical protein
VLKEFENTYDGVVTNTGASTTTNEALAVAGITFLASAVTARRVTDALMLANHPARKGIDSRTRYGRGVTPTRALRSGWRARRGTRQRRTLLMDARARLIHEFSAAPMQGKHITMVSASQTPLSCRRRVTDSKPCFEYRDPTKWARLGTMIPESSTVLLVAGVCAVVTGVGGGTAAPVNTSASTISAVTVQAPAQATRDTPAPPISPGSAALLPGPPTAPAHCTASPRNATPRQISNQTITVHTTRGADVNLAVHYPTTTRAFTIVADSAGTAVITFPISPSVPGSPVQVDVSTNSGQVCDTQFTPR